MLPNNATIQADKKGFLPLHNSLTDIGQKALSFPNLTNESLLSVGQLCDDDCVILFDKKKVTVKKDDKIILQGKRCHKDNLYDIDLLQNHTTSDLAPSKTINHTINYIIRKDKTSSDLAQYLFATAFSPSMSTFQKAIKNGNFVTWPGIHKLQFEKLIGTTIASEKGHLDQERKGLQSTIHPTNEDDDDNFPNKTNERTNNRFVTIYDTAKTHNTTINPILKAKAYMDLTGRFPHMSSRGNQYLVVIYDYDTNAIVFEPIKTRQSKEVFNAFKKCDNKISHNNIAPKFFVLDNEAAADLKLGIVKNNQSYQVVPPNQHRRNAAEKAIRTFKNHF